MVPSPFDMLCYTCPLSANKVLLHHSGHPLICTQPRARGSHSVIQSAAHNARCLCLALDPVRMIALIEAPQAFQEFCLRVG